MSRTLAVRRASVICPMCQRPHRSPTSDVCRPCRHRGMARRVCPECHTHTLEPYQRHRCTWCADGIEVARIERIFAAEKAKHRANRAITDDVAWGWASPLSGAVKDEEATAHADAQ